MNERQVVVETTYEDVAMPWSPQHLTYARFKAAMAGANEHVKALITSLTKILSTSEYSDLTIECRDRNQFIVHKAVMCSSSSVLKGLCESQIREGLPCVIRDDRFDVYVN